jgi:peptidyl-prolyl cis-trans isomerase A (cyclophilin A)
MMKSSVMRWMQLAAVVVFASPLVLAVDDAAPIRVEFQVNLSPGNVGTFSIDVHPEWAPLGAARFLELVDLGPIFWKGMRFFRVIGKMVTSSTLSILPVHSHRVLWRTNPEGFMAQFGIPGNYEVADEWREKHIKDDPVIKSNARGYISFATSGEDKRTTQMFINLVDNSNLDDMGFSPFGGERRGCRDYATSDGD